MWWLWENVPHSNLDGAYTAAGYLGQNITVLPQMDAVIAYKTNSIYERGNSRDTQVSVIIKIARMYNADIGDVKRQLSDSFSRKEIKEAIADFYAIKKVCSSLNFEPFLNMLGYEFLGKGEYKTALAIFKLNVQEYPDSWNVYDSMAEGFEQSGDVQNAIDYYKKSIELNPENEHGISKLKKLTAND
jgi:tetratricopeptide (TPR) repeat protein